jgi:hypothetical protein
MYAPGQQNDVIVSIALATRNAREERNVAGYDAVIYSQLPLPVETPRAMSRYKSVLRNLPMRGVERLDIHSKSEELLASFIEGEKSLPMMRDKLLGFMSDGLRRLLTEIPSSMRVWWATTTPELDDLPWELTVEAGRRDGAHRVAFLRGLPPETPIPTVPLAHEPRIGMIGARHLWPEWANVLEAKLGSAVVPIDGTLRAGFAQAVEQRIEFVHAFADGIVSSALEGLLFDHGVPSSSEGQREISVGELSSMLRNSCVAVLAFSRAEYRNPDVVEMAGREVPSAYRAFALIGNAARPLPTILAPLGPIPDREMTTFWSAFYTELRTSWHLTESLRRTQSKFSISMPVALFCRHAGGKLFEPVANESESQPMQVRADLLRSQQLTRELGRIKEKYNFDLPAGVNELLQKETSRQSDLLGTLDTFIKPSEEL